MMQDETNGEFTNAAVYRKVKDTCRSSVFEQIEWAIDALGVSDLWESSVSPMQHTYKPTGQKILYRGLDKAKKSKSVKVSKGYIKYLWFEELDEFAGIEEIRTVQQSILRGGPKFIVFKTFNPPISVNNWANKYVAEAREDSYRHKSNYTTVPAEWLGPQFYVDADYLKETNERAYKHEYLGIPVGLGTNIFELLEIRTITDEEIARQEKIYQGQDWGYYPDPKAFVRCSYMPASQKILCIDELGGQKIRNTAMSQMIIDRGYNDYSISCGADEIESILDFRDAGLVANKTNVYPGSRKYSYEWLQCRTLVIDPVRTPRLYEEVISYEHEVDENGEIKAEYPDGNDHFIDALRYATSPMSMRRGESA
jgi:PBSX family phage terminase large subunit